MMPTVGIVAGCKTKLATPAPARELYTSPLFRAAAAFAEATYDRWLVLSALHGLVEPDQTVEPYDVTLKGMSQARRLDWIAMVAMQGLARGWRRQCGPRRAQGMAESPAAAGDAEIFLHAGRLYRRPFWEDSVFAPLAGLGIGQQLAWYAARRSERGG